MRPELRARQRVPTEPAVKPMPRKNAMLRRKVFDSMPYLCAQQNLFVFVFRRSGISSGSGYCVAFCVIPGFLTRVARAHFHKSHRAWRLRNTVLIGSGALHFFIGGVEQCERAIALVH